MRSCHGNLSKLKMSKGKKGKPASENVSWDEGLVNESVYDESWTPYLIFLAPGCAGADEEAKLLAGAADGGNRKKFVVIDKEKLLQSAHEDAKLTAAASSGGGGAGKKSKMGSTIPTQKPLHVEVCEHVVSALSDSGEVPPALLAKLLKYKILKKRTEDVAAREALKKEAEATLSSQKPAGGDGKKKGGASGRTSKATGVKKGKETPAAEAIPEVPVPAKPPTTMIKRGDEDLDSKYINDEPLNGPSCYFIMMGFTSAEFFQQLAPIKLTANALFRVTGRDQPPATDDDEMSESETSLGQYWKGIVAAIRSTASGSMLRDMPLLDIPLADGDRPQATGEKAVRGQVLFDALAMRVYGLLEQRQQYEHYLDYLDIQPLPLAAGKAETEQLQQPGGQRSVDMRFYNDLLSAVPPESADIPLLLHCMVEQVCSTLSEDSNGVNADSLGGTPAVMNEINSLIGSLALSADEKLKLENSSASPTLASQPCPVFACADKATGETFYLKDSKLLAVSKAKKAITEKSVLQSCFVPPIHSSTKFLQDHTKLHALEHFSLSEGLPPSVFNYALILLSLERFNLPDSSASTTLQLQCSPSSLLLDHPFAISCGSLSTEKQALVPFQSDIESVDDHSGVQHVMITLPEPITDLSTYSVLEVLNKHSVLQLLHGLQETHPYIEVVHHKHSQSIVLVAHTGFKGELMYKRKWKTQAHSKVGFGNYLQYVAESYGNIVDEAVAQDIGRREAFELNRKTLEEKLTLQTTEQPGDDAKGVKASGSSAASVKKTPVGKSPAGKHSKLSSKECTPAPSTINLEPIPEFEDQQLFAAYDIGDTVLQNTGIITTQFTADGVQIRTERQQFVEGNESIHVSVISAANTITATTVTGDTTLESNKVGDGKEENGDGIIKPQPPVIFSSLKASFADSLRVSISHYGPGGNGLLPYEPPKPAILDEATSSLDSRPQSQLAPSPQKGSKKQQEQQQLLEQQRLLEETKLQAREAANAKYQEQLSDLVRSNKHQQLFASTVFGLQVHFQISDSEAGESDINSNVLVKQSYPVQSKGAQETDKHLLRAAFIEKQRCYTPEGSIIRFMKDDSIVMYSADGSIYRTASAAETEHLDSASEDNFKQSLSQADIEESATKVTFEDTSPEISRLEVLQEKVWVVTLPTGKRYLWKKSKGPDDQSEDKEDSEHDVPKDDTDEPASESTPAPSSHIVILPPVQIFPATDPVTKEVLITRDDGVTVLERPNGTRIAEFPDGSRFTTSFDESTHNCPSRVIMECPGFARVTFHLQNNQCSVTFPDGAEIVCSNKGSYAVKKENEYRFEINSDGEATFKVSSLTNDREMAVVCTINHQGTPVILSATDTLGNNFTVDLNEEKAVMEASNERIAMHKAFKPRYFVIQPDETAYELLEEDHVNRIITAGREDSRAAVIEESLPGESQLKATTLIQPVEVQKKCHILPYLEDSIVPVNLRLTGTSNGFKHEKQQNNKTKKIKFGVSTGRGLMIGSYKKPPSQQKLLHPDALSFRQFVKVTHPYSTLKHQVLTKVSSFDQWCQQQKQTSDQLQLTDSRSDTEIAAAEELKMQFRGIEKSKVHHSYVQMCLTPEEQLPASIPKRSQQGINFINGAKKEIEETEQIKQALRHQHIVPYFKSEEGKEYLKAKPPDMTDLAAQLAQPNTSLGNTVSGYSTPSTLQSTSLILPIVDADSPTQSELGPTSSLSKIRPSHPTPDHAQGRSTPTELRPTNPTPSQALNISSNDEDAFSLSADSNKNLLSFTGNTTSTGISIARPTNPTPGKAWVDMNSQPTVNLEIEAASKYVDVTGSPRKAPVESPASVLGGRPGEQENTKFSQVEEPARRKVHTSSTASVPTVRGFQVFPEQVHFGELKEGSTYSFSVSLKNTGIDSCRFKIKQPPPSTGIKVIYTPGPVAAGMSRKIDIEVFALAVGAVGEYGVGSVQHDLQIISEASVLQLPIRATVLTSPAYDQKQAENSLGKVHDGVKTITNRPASKESLTRPART